MRMLEILRKFFHFCDERERREFYRSIALGVAAALFSALKIPAIGILLGAMLTDGVRTETILRTPHGAHNRAHVLHVLKLQVGRIRRIHRRRLNPVQEQRRARAIPTDTRRPGIRLEGDVA